MYTVFLSELIKHINEKHDGRVRLKYIFNDKDVLAINR